MGPTNFCLELDWRVEDGAESGILFHMLEPDSPEDSSKSGLEYQIVDDLKHPEARTIDTHLSGASFDVYTPKYKIAKQAGEYNRAWILADHGRIEHWINGIKVVEYELGSPDWKEKVSSSLFAREPKYGKTGKGHIVLQTNVGKVWFKNIRIRSL